MTADSIGKNRSGGAERWESPSDRRRVLAGMGAGIAGGLAGCLDTLGGGGGGATEENPKVTIGTFPVGDSAAALKYAENSGIIEEEMSAAGYEYELNFTFKDSPLYASGQIDISGISELEAAKLGVEQELETTIFARKVTSAPGMTVKAGSKWDPKQTGSVQATIDKVAEEGKVAIIGWNAGHLQAARVALEEAYGKALRPKKGDFSIVTTEFAARGKLLAQGEAAMSPVLPEHNPGLFLDDTLKPLFYAHDKLMELGLGMPSTGGWSAQPGFIEKHPEAAKALLRATNKGTAWLFEDGLEEIPQNDEYMKTIGAKNEKQAEYILKWAMHKEGVKYPTEHPFLLKDVSLDEQEITRTKKFLTAVTEAGLLKSGWNEYVSFTTL